MSSCHGAALESPPHRSSDQDPAERPLRERALRQLGFLVGAVVLVTVGGLVAGYLYAKGSPERAASSFVSDFVQSEPNVGDAPPRAGEAAPTSGRHDGSPRCGSTSEVVSVDDQLATLATGAVVVQYRPEDVGEPAVLDELARREDVLVAPNPALSDPVVATAWTQRMRLPAATPELLFAFVTAHRGLGPDAPAACPRIGGGSGQ